MDLNVMAQRWLMALRGKCAVEGGLAFAEEAAAAVLDDSPASLRRLDQLLQYARSRDLSSPEAFGADPARMNFARGAAVHLGEHIAARLEQDIHWYTRDGLLAKLTPDFDLPAAFFTELTATVSGSVCLPLGQVEQALFGPQPAPSCEQYVQGFVERVRTGQLEENAWAARYLASLEDGSYLPGGLAFRAELKALGLDYSLDSLERVDAFLVALREREPPEYGAFVGNGYTSNLLLVLAYYVAATVARAGHIAMKWVTHDFALQLAPDLELTFDTARGCLLDGRLWFPLQAVSGRLFGRQQEHSCVSFAREVLSHAPRVQLVPLRRPLSDVPRLRDELPALWKRALVELGRAAAVHMFMISGGSFEREEVPPFVPVLSEPNGESMTFVTLMYESLDDAVKEGLQRVQDPRRPFCILAYDSFANLPSGRIDALCLELRCHHDEPLALTVSVPYRRRAGDRPFAIHTPHAAGTVDPRLPAELLAQVFHESAGDMRVGDFSWDMVLDERL